jgi:hypothetical protein
MDEAYQADVETGGPGRHLGRLLATLLGVAVTLVAADIVKTAGGLTVLIALVALVGLVDRTGWLTRLAGTAGLVVFVLFGIQCYRFYGHDLGTAAQHMQPGAWLLLVGGVVLLVAGIFGSHVVVGVPAGRSATGRPVVH